MLPPSPQDFLDAISYREASLPGPSSPSLFTNVSDHLTSLLCPYDNHSERSFSAESFCWTSEAPTAKYIETQLLHDDPPFQAAQTFKNSDNDFLGVGSEHPPLYSDSPSDKDTLSESQADPDPFLIYDETDWEDENDRDYVPFPLAGSRKRGRSTYSVDTSSRRPSKRPVLAHNFSSSTPSLSSSSNSPTRQHPPPRNRQVHINLSRIHEYNFVCPVEDCKWNDKHPEITPARLVDVGQKGKKSKAEGPSQPRLPDFKRHLTSHMKPVHIKCPSCQKPFSRSDALVRHNRTAHSANTTPSPTPSKRQKTVKAGTKA